MVRNLTIFLMLCWSFPLTASPRVVTSILPLHSLAAGVMEGVGEPQLLIGANASPHDYALKPSDARALSKAELIVWVGEGLETVLEQPIRTLSGRATVLELSAVEGVRLLPSRRGGIWQEDEHERGHEGHEHGGMDTHLWLSPENARRTVHAVAAQLSELDAANAERYHSNADAMERRITELEARLQAQLAPVREQAYIVFHDAYHYFEDAFALHPAGAIAVSPDRRPGARRLIEIRRAIAASGVRCVFSEPQFQSAIVDVVLEDSHARHGVLDPVGAPLAPGKEQWFALMQGLADSLEACLSSDL